MRSVALLSLFVLACSSSSSSGADSGAPAKDASVSNDPDAMEMPDEGPPPCEYPAGPYGFQLGKTIPPSLNWEGYLPGSNTITKITAAELFDCDGRHGIHAVLFDEAALWCGPCQQEAKAIPDYVKSTAKPNGIVIVTLVVEDLKGMPASTADALTWRNQFGLNDIHVFADPGFFFSTPQGSNGLPTNVILDPRTMKVTKVTQGWSGKFEPELLALAKKNQM